MITPPSLLMRLRQPAEPAAWEEFVRLYTPLLYGWTRRLRIPEQDADDLIQDVFVILLRKLPGFVYEPSRSFRAWLWTVFLNRWHRTHRRDNRSTRTSAYLEQLEAPDSASSFDEIDYRNYLAGRALRIMQDHFEPTTWRACWEYVVRDRPAAEVAAELGVSVAVVYAAKSRVLRRLRHELEGLLD